MMISRRPSGLRKTTNPDNSLAHRTTWLRSDLRIREGLHRCIEGGRVGGDVGEDGGGVGEDRGDDGGPRQRSGATGSKGERAPLLILLP